MKLLFLSLFALGERGLEGASKLNYETVSN
jgi:hypothetical protein